MTPDERAAIRTRAAARARAMGLRGDDDRPPPDGTPAPAPVPLPTTNPRALRALLDHGHLTPDQAAAARRLFTAAAQYARDEDAA